MIIRFFGREYIFPVWVKITIIILVFAVLTGVGFVVEKRSESGIMKEIVPAETGMSSSGGASKPTSNIPFDCFSPEASAFSPETPCPELIFIYIVGEIKTPGVYEIADGSILNDLVKKAGGFTEKADKEAVNLASALKNGMMIKIPSVGNSEKSWIIDGGTSTSSGSSSASGQKININTASVADLCTLPGIGESTALKIINYRTENGRFKTIEDIMNVSGIKTSRYNDIKAFITVG